MAATRHRIDVFKALSALAVLAGLAMYLWPVVTEVVVAERAREKISEIDAVYDSMGDAEHAENLTQAHAYNDRLRGVATDVEIWDYDEQLTYHDEPSTMMAWIEIPKIGSSIPVYHHTTEAVLMAGVGHVDTTSLPVGGEGTLCALSGHSGMPDTRMFDDIRLLGEGDRFVVWTLHEPYCYEVTETHVIDPDETWVLEPRVGRDVCELITCTPINVNTQRLVVVGERCDYEPEAGQMRRSVESVANRRTAPLLLGVMATVAVVGLTALVKRKRKGRRPRA